MNKNFAAKAHFEWNDPGLSVYMFDQHNLCDINVNFDTYLYLTQRHLSTQTSEKVHYFFLFRDSENTAAAIFQCICDDYQHCISPPRAPFGGIQCDKKCSPDEVNFLLKCIDELVLTNRSKKIIISTAAADYELNINTLLNDCYYTNGYIETKQHVNHSIPVTSLIYANLIHKSEKRRLKKCKLAGFVCEIYSPPDVNMVYDFLRFCRAEKGYTISLTVSQLEEIFIRFPNYVNIFTVKQEDRLIALTVTIQVNKSILYNFLSASLSSYNHYSPVVFLTEAVYIFCQKEKILILDLGTSLDHLGKEKAGLIRFKENIGGVRSNKITYEKIPDNQTPRQLPSL